jgi:hypothetical protein
MRCSPAMCSAVDSNCHGRRFAPTPAPLTESCYGATHPDLLVFLPIPGGTPRSLQRSRSRARGVGREDDKAKPRFRRHWCTP